MRASLVDGGHEIVDRHTGTPDQRAQSAASDVIVVGYRERCGISRFGEDNVAPALPGDLPTELERSDDLRGFQEPQRRHSDRR